MLQTRTQRGLVRNTVTITVTNLLPLSGIIITHYDEFEDWKIHGYQLPAAIFGIIRTEDEKTGAIEEFTYRSEHHAHERLKKCMAQKKKVILATMEGVWHLKSRPPLDFIDP